MPSERRGPGPGADLRKFDSGSLLNTRFRRRGRTHLLTALTWAERVTREACRWRGVPSRKGSRAHRNAPRGTASRRCPASNTESGRGCPELVRSGRLTGRAFHLESIGSRADLVTQCRRKQPETRGIQPEAWFTKSLHTSCFLRSAGTAEIEGSPVQVRPRPLLRSKWQ
jgi:hypothetical protein